MKAEDFKKGQYQHKITVWQAGLIYIFRRNIF